MVVQKDHSLRADLTSTGREELSLKIPSSAQTALLPPKSLLTEDVNSIAIPQQSEECSWKDYLAVGSCLLSFSVAVSVVFVQKWAVYWGVTGQFVWIGLCLTLMSWCSQLFLRRLFLVAAIHFQPSSTLQTLDSILRSDPLTSNATWTLRIVLFCMLGLAPALSAVYKTLGGGESSFAGEMRDVHVGLTGPPGTQHIGYGLSQFINATLPWFEQPGLNRTYGFNVYTLDENTTAVLDGPMPSDVQLIQESLKSGQWTRLTGEVTALVCFLNPNLEYDRAKLSQDFAADQPGRKARQFWSFSGNWNKALFFPDVFNSTNLYLSAFNVSAGESFGGHARHYELMRQTYTATWHISQVSIELESAVPANDRRLDDQGVFTGIYVAIPELLLPGLVEYDAYYREAGYLDAGIVSNEEEFTPYKKDIKTDATPLAIAVWSRYVAWLGPETWRLKSTSSRLSEAQQSTLLYMRTMSIQKGAITIKRNWPIVLVLSMNPLLLLGSFLSRVLVWPRSPIGGGFGVVSLLASMDKDCQPLLHGAGLSGRLNRPLTVWFDVRGATLHRRAFTPRDSQTGNTGQITMYLGRNGSLKSGTLERGVLYR